MGMLGASRQQGMKRRIAVLDRAREIDPEAFKGVKIMQFFPEQQAKQIKAIERAEREISKDT